MKGGVGSRWRIHPVEEARRREVMAGMGVYDADWALCKVLKESDVKKGQNRLLLTKKLVCGGPIPTLFPELEELDDDGLNAQRMASFTLLDGEGREKYLTLRYLNSNLAYRVKGPAWKLFVQESGICKGDRLDLYACRRGDGECCLFSFTSKGGGGASAWCNSVGRKRARQPAAAGSAAVLDHKRRRPAKSGRAERDNGQMGYVMLNDACTRGLRFQGDYYGSCKTREDNTPSSRSWKYDAAKSRKKKLPEAC